jgi:hypothetical protein
MVLRPPIAVPRVVASRLGYGALESVIAGFNRGKVWYLIVTARGTIPAKITLAAR